MTWWADLNAKLKNYQTSWHLNALFVECAARATRAIKLSHVSFTGACHAHPCHHVYKFFTKQYFWYSNNTSSILCKHCFTLL